MKYNYKWLIESVKNGSGILAGVKLTRVCADGGKGAFIAGLSTDDQG